MIINLELEGVRRLKKRAFTQSAISLFVSLLLLAASCYLNAKILEAGYITALLLIVFGTALITLSIAFGPVVTFRPKIKGFI